jgi:cytochrome c oxidase subunit 2
LVLSVEEQRKTQMSTQLKLAALIAVLGCYLGTGSAGNGPRTIEIHAHRYAFSPSEITVKKGETVKLELFSDDVPHSLLIKDLDINQTITRGKPSEVTFTPEKSGDFHGQCGHFCGSGHGKMAFAVHVTGD